MSSSSYVGRRNQLGAVRFFLQIWPEAEGKGAEGEGDMASLIGVFTRPVLRAGDCKATRWKASKESATTGLLEKFSISVTSFDSISVERRERCDLSSNSIGRLRRCLSPGVGGRVSDRLRWWRGSAGWSLLRGAESGLGEIGIGEWADPNIVLAVGTGSGVVGDGGTLGLGSGGGHKVGDVAKDGELII